MAVASLLFVTGSGGRAARAQQVAYAGAVQLATGSYVFRERTNSLAIVSGLDFATPRIRLWTNVPIIVQNTPWVSFTGTGMVPSGGTESAMMGRQSSTGGMMRRGGMMMPDTGAYVTAGVGDPTAGLSVEALRESERRPSVRVTLGAKGPVASPAHGFGTGAWDYGLGLSASKLVGRTYVLADAAYWVMGDLPELELKNAVAYGGALGRPLTADGRVAGLVSFSGFTSLVSSLPAPRQLGVGVNYQFASRRSIGATASFGLSAGAPDLVLAMSWRMRL